MPRQITLLSAAACLLLASLTAQEPDVRETIRELRERLDEIEGQQVVTSEIVGDRAVVKAFSAKSLDLGGHVSSLFTSMHGESGTETGHLVSVVELFIKAEVDDEWSLFAAPGFYTFNGGLLDNPTTPTTAGDPLLAVDTSAIENLFVSRIYGQWHASDLLRLQGGIVGSPHGTTNREYFIPARSIAAGNLHTRVFLANQLYPQMLRGIKASSKQPIGNHDWIELDAYFGSDDNGPADGLGGARLAYAFGESGLTLAANYGRGSRQATPTPATNLPILQSPFLLSYNLSRDYQFGGIDVDWRRGAFIFKGEAYYSAESGLRDQRALSLESTWFVEPEWGLSYRYDFYDAGADLNLFLATPQVAARGISTEHVIGISYNPDPNVRIRLDLHHNNLPNTADTVQFVNLSWSLSF